MSFSNDIIFLDQTLIDGQVLVELCAGEDIVAKVHQVDIYVPTAGGIVGVPLGRSLGVFVITEQINVIDLIMQGGRSGPNQCAHAAIADGKAVVGAWRGGVEREVSMRDQAAVVVFEQTVGGLRAGCSNCQQGETQGCKFNFHD